MESTQTPRGLRGAYEKVALSDPEIDSEDGTLTPTPTTTTPLAWPGNERRHRRSMLMGTLWLTVRIGFVVALVGAWGASMWLTHVAARELRLAHALIPDLKTSIKGAARLAQQQPTTPPPAPAAPLHNAPSAPFLPGGTLPVPGYGLVYNTSYCNGWADPAGAAARGCVLDASQGGWVHELCHDPDLLREWLQLPDFGWFLDPHGHQRIAQDRVWAADIPGGVHTPLYTARDFHVQHCKFVMRLRVKNGMRRNRGLGYLPLDPGHMYHCLHMMTELSANESRELTAVTLGEFGGGTEGFGLAGECYLPVL